MVREATARVVRRSAAVLRIALALVGLVPLVGAAVHPLHTTITEVTTDAAGRTVHAVIRVFADDFGKAIARGPHMDAAGGVTETAALRYLQRTFALTAHDGRVLPLRSCGVRRTTDLLWLCVEAALPTGRSGTRVRNSMLHELYDDQVNIVRVSHGGTLTNLMFTRNEGAKALP